MTEGTLSETYDLIDFNNSNEIIFIKFCQICSSPFRTINERSEYFCSWCLDVMLKFQNNQPEWEVQKLYKETMVHYYQQNIDNMKVLKNLEEEMRREEEEDELSNTEEQLYKILFYLKIIMKIGHQRDNPHISSFDSFVSYNRSLNSIFNRFVTLFTQDESTRNGEDVSQLLEFIIDVANNKKTPNDSELFIQF